MDVEYELSARQVERNILAAELDEEELWDCERYHQLGRQIEKLQSVQSTETESPTE